MVGLLVAIFAIGCDVGDLVDPFGFDPLVDLLLVGLSVVRLIAGDRVGNFDALPFGLDSFDDLLLVGLSVAIIVVVGWLGDLVYPVGDLLLVGLCVTVFVAGCTVGTLTNIIAGL